MMRRLPQLCLWHGKFALQHAQQRQHASLTGPLQRAFVAARYVAGAAGVGGLAWGAAQADAVADNARLAYLIPTRLARDVAAAASIVADYKVTLRGAAGEAGAEREAALAACHQRAADRLLSLCFANGGIYIKLGQHVGQLDHLLPPEYVLTMRQHLLDRCPTSTPEEVRAIIQQDLGAAPEQLFASFDPTPIASASLAQVHVARDHDGRQMAVKVQHAGLRESAAADIATISALVQAVKFIFPSFDYEWLVEEVKQNLPLELDFKHEAANAAEAATNLASPKSRLGGRVHVPAVDLSRTSHRVLTMEFIDGARVTDRAALAAAGVDASELARLVAEAFNEMIFTFGFVHCDPHAANLLARRVGGRTQLVLLDHGLYRRIDDDFRAAYAALWRSLIFADKPGIRRYSERMNAGDAYPVFAAMLTQKPWEQVVEADLGSYKAASTKEEREQLQRLAAAHAHRITELLARIPRPLLLLLKTNDCLRAVDVCLGQPVNTLVITARECTRALAELERERRPGLGAWLAGVADVWRVEALMVAMRLAAWWGGRLRGGGRRDRGAGGGEAQELGAAGEGSAALAA